VTEPHPGAEVLRRTLTWTRIGLVAGLCLAAVYLVVLALGDTEFNKSVGFSLLLVGFPTLFAIVPLLEWLGVQGGKPEALALIPLTLLLNGALWGAAAGAITTLGSLGYRKWVQPRG
jgi:hypothetical protein